MNKLEKLEKELKKLQKELYNTTKLAEYHNRELRKFDSVKDKKKVAKHAREEQDYRIIQNNISLKIKTLEGQLAEEQLKINEKNYQKKLRNFYLPFKELLENLIDLLKADKWKEGIEEVEGLTKWFEEEKKKINPVDVKAIERYINFRNIRNYISKIISNYARAEEVKFSYGDKISRGFLLNHQREKKIPIGILQSTLDIVNNILNPKKKSKSLLKKLSEKIASKKKDAPVKEQPRTGVVTTKSFKTIAESTRSKTISPMPMTVKDHERAALERARKRLEENKR